MHPMIGKTFQLRFPDGLRTYEIVNVDIEEGWIKMKRQGVSGHFYMHETIHRHFLDKIGYIREQRR
jgi:hypothetical protein